MSKYDDFIKNKINYGKSTSVGSQDINPMLFDFQRDIVKWALKKGRAAIFADTGLGKTFMQIEWAKNVAIAKQGKVIIFAPLSVNEQTIDEGAKLGVKVQRYDAPGDNNIIIANYENLDKIDCRDYVGIVLDESSILKSLDGKTKHKLIEFAQDIEYRLACTATPAPNDISEIANHTEFLGIMKRESMLAMWFYNNGKEWTLKGHAENRFYEWVATWGFFLTKPSDIGYSDKGFVLPALKIDGLYFDYEFKRDGALFSMGLKGIEDRIKIRKDTVEIKAKRIADMVNADKSDQFIIWCGIDAESNTMSHLIVGAENLKGADTNTEKIRKIKEFKAGKIRVLITKPKIAGFGLNFQNCHRMIFFGLSDSYEAYYQCIRRCYRFGQKKPVDVLIALAGDESQILANIKRKETDAQRISAEVIKHIANFEKKEIGASVHEKLEYKEDKNMMENCQLLLGDSCIRMKEIEDDSIDLSVFSPPFSSLYTYSSSDRDLGNCRDDKEFFQHFDFIIKELLRITKPGRNVALHCMNLPTRKMVDGFIGLRDFRGDIIRAFQAAGWIYHSEVTIDKNPQIAAIRTKAKGLMFKQLHKDSSDSRQGLADYIVVFKKRGENAIPIIPDVNNDEWIRLAHPVWYEIKESETLQSVKFEKDEKHICPLQLEVIENCIRLWSNKGETVFSPFMGIGSEGYMALKLDRKFIGIELKPEYYNQAKKNIAMAEHEIDANKNMLFSMADVA